MEPTPSSADGKSKQSNSMSIGSGNSNKHDKAQQQQKFCSIDSLILTMLDAMQILSNQAKDCEDKIEQHILTAKRLEKEMQYAKVSQTEAKIVQLKKDKTEYEKDFKMITQPFMKQQETNQFRMQLSIRKNSSIEQNYNEFRIGSQKEQEYADMANFQNKLKKLGQNAQSKMCEGKRCSLIFLTFWLVLELSVTMYKFNFVNLLTILMGYFLLIQNEFRPNMAQITVVGSFLTIVFDGIWLWLYSYTYLTAKINSGLQHQLKAFFQYAWFITVLQIFIKLIYVWFLRHYKNSGNLKRATDQRYEQATQLAYSNLVRNMSIPTQHSNNEVILEINKKGSQKKHHFYQYKDQEEQQQTVKGNNK